jgi:hypothetical protein
MNKTETANPDIQIDEKVIELVKTSSSEEQQVIVHCLFRSGEWARIRIWNTTYLCDNHSDHRSRLLNAFNISYYPVWMFVPPDKTISFTLVFEALPKTCTDFDLFEDIPASGGFFVRNIRRNKSDVYSVWIG